MGDAPVGRDVEDGGEPDVVLGEVTGAGDRGGEPTQAGEEPTAASPPLDAPFCRGCGEPIPDLVPVHDDADDPWHGECFDERPM